MDNSCKSVAPGVGQTLRCRGETVAHTVNDGNQAACLLACSRGGTTPEVVGGGEEGEGGEAECKGGEGGRGEGVGLSV